MSRSTPTKQQLNKAIRADSNNDGNISKSDDEPDDKHAQNGEPGCIVDKNIPKDDKKLQEIAVDVQIFYPGTGSYNEYDIYIARTQSTESFNLYNADKKPVSWEFYPANCVHVGTINNLKKQVTAKYYLEGLKMDRFPLTLKIRRIATDLTSESITFSVLDFGLAIDSDNTGTIGDYPGMEAYLKNHPYALGKIVYARKYEEQEPDYFHLVVPNWLANVNNVTLKLEYIERENDNGIRIYRNSTLASGQQYPLGNIGAISDNHIYLYIEGGRLPAANSKRHTETLSLGEAPHDKIKATLKIKNKEYKDSAQYIVIDYDSIYRHLNASRHIRAAYTADSVYQEYPAKTYRQFDQKQHCIQLLENATDAGNPEHNLDALVLPARAAELLTGGGDWGFRAAIYKDFYPKKGVFEYVITFEGTNFPVSPVSDLWTDIRNARGRLTRQYKYAIEIGEKVRDANLKTIYYSGHSLGGGLASAAAVIEEKKAYIFNPAWVAKGIFDSQYHANYNEHRTYISTYVVDGDILNTYLQNKIYSVQGSITNLPPKPNTGAGNLHRMDAVFWGLFNPHGVY